MAEALNFSGVDLKLFFDANTAATISIFTFLVIPPFLLCLLCVLALVLAKDINAKIRLLLINIFTAETLSGFSFFFMYLGWSAQYINEEGTSYKMLLSLNNLAGLLKFSGTSLYTVVGVYIFIKHGDKKFKWYVIIPYSCSMDSSYPYLWACLYISKSIELKMSKGFVQQTYSQAHTLGWLPH